MSYVDCFVAAVPIENKAAYLKHAKMSAEVFQDHGALDIYECWGDDIPDGKVTSLPKAVQCEEGETVVFSFVLWPDKDARNEGWGKIEADPRMADESNPMPFDGARLIFGGFDLLLKTLKA